MALDFEKQSDEPFRAMQGFGSVPIELLLPAGRARSRRCGFNESDRRTIYEDPFLREPEDGCIFESSGTCGKSEADSKTDETDGNPGNFSRAQHQPASAGACSVSVPLEKSFNQKAQSGLERGHHVHPTLEGVCLSGGDSRLVFPLRSLLETLEQPGDSVLHGGSRRGIGTWKSRHLQYGSGLPVHECGFYETAAGTGNPDQHGLKRPCLRQHLHGKTLEERQIRRRLPEGLSDDERGSVRTEKLLSVLQPRKISPGARLSNTARSSWHCTNRKVIHIFTMIHKRERKKEAKKEREKQATTTKIIV